MVEIYALTLFFMFLTPAVALLDNAGVKYGFISHPPYSRFTKKVKDLGAEGYCAAAVIISVSALTILAGSNFASGVKTLTIAGGVVMAAIVVSTLALGLVTLRATNVYNSSPKTLNVVASSVALLVVLVASIYADAHITQSIGVKGSDLPSALRVMTILLAAYWWTLVFSGVSFCLYVITLLLWAEHTVTLSDKEMQRRSFVMLGKRAPTKETSKEFVYFALFIGFAFSALIPLNLLASFEKEKRFVRLANELLVFASFHLSKHDCFPNAQKGSVFALIDAERVAIATPNEKVGFTYELKKCVMGKDPK